MLPLMINFSKIHTDFIIEFFFTGEIETNNEEEMRNMLMNHSEFLKNQKTKKEGNINIEKGAITEIQIGSTVINPEKIEKQANEIKQIDYPIFFKHFKIDETELIISYNHAEKSYLVNR